jgi:hypothetical protein
MSAYPYDREKFRGGSSDIILKKAFDISFELMHLYEPFGQAASTYEDTGYPEFVALGIRTFLSVPENIAMMKSIGKSTFNALVTMGKVYTRDKKKEELKGWKRLMAEMKKADIRTYNSIQGEMKKEVKKSQ